MTAPKISIEVVELIASPMANEPGNITIPDLNHSPRLYMQAQPLNPNVAPIDQISIQPSIQPRKGCVIREVNM